MTPDELRAAAERLRKVAENMKDPGDASPISRVYAWDTIPGGPTYDGDRRAIIAAYLAEHPADDETPIDREWLARLGCKRDDWGSGTTDFTIPSDGVQLDIRVWADEACGIDGIAYNQNDTGNVQVDVKTRGDVRRLCDAVGIKLKESEK